MAKSIVQLVLTIRNPVVFVKNYVRIHIIFKHNARWRRTIYESQIKPKPK